MAIDNFDIARINLHNEAAPHRIRPVYLVGELALAHSADTKSFAVEGQVVQPVVDGLELAGRILYYPGNESAEGTVIEIGFAKLIKDHMFIPGRTQTVSAATRILESRSGPNTVSILGLNKVQQLFKEIALLDESLEEDFDHAQTLLMRGLYLTATGHFTKGTHRKQTYDLDKIRLAPMLLDTPINRS